MSHKSRELMEPKLKVRVLPPWCDEHHLRSIVVVAAKDHSRGLQRVLERVMKGHPTRVAVQPARYSSFDPDRWWETRDVVRTEIIELQKLLLERPVIPGTPPMAAELLKNCQSLTVDYCQPCVPSHSRHRFGSLPGAVSYLAVLSLLPGQVLAALSFSPALTLVRTVLTGPLEGFAIFGLPSENNLAIVSEMLRGREAF